MMTSVIIVVVHRKTTFKLLFTNNLPFQQALNHCKWGESVELGKKGTEFNGFIDLNVVPQSYCMGSDDFKYNSRVQMTLNIIHKWYGPLLCRFVLTGL